jgi:hypothetical protein
MGARNILLVVVTLTGLFLFAEGSGKMSISLQPIEALQQSMSKVCSVTSCLTTTCTNGQPCQTFRSNSDPIASGQPQNNIIITQPLEDTTMKPLEDTMTMQPPEDDMEVIEGIINDD